MLDVIRIGEKVRDAVGGGDFAGIFEVVTANDVFEPGGAGFDGDGVAIEILKRAHGRIGMEQDALRIALHGGADGDQWFALRIAFENMVGGAHSKLRSANGDLLLGDVHRSAGENGDVETFLTVVALEQRIVKATVFGLRVPVCLETDGDEAGGGCRAMASCGEGKQCQECKRGADATHDRD